MPQSENLNIALIVAKDAGSQLVSIAASSYVWVRDTAENAPYVAQLQERTTFEAEDRADPVALVLENLEMVERTL